MLIGSLAGLALIGGTAAVGLGAANATTPGPDRSTGGSAHSEKQEPQSAGSITVPESATEQSESEESLNLAKLATVDPKTAEAAAVASVPGSTAVSTTLGDENGSLVYEVKLTDTAGAGIEVAVDAGNSAILNTESDANEQGEKAETDDGADQETADDQGTADGEQNDAQEAAASANS